MYTCVYMLLWHMPTYKYKYMLAVYVYKHTTYVSICWPYIALVYMSSPGGRGVAVFGTFRFASIYEGVLAAYRLHTRPLYNRFPC